MTVNGAGAARREEAKTRKYSGRNCQFLGFVSAYLSGRPSSRLLCVGMDLSKVHSSMAVMHFDSPDFKSGGSPVLASFGTKVDKSLSKHLRGAFLCELNRWVTHYLEDARTHAVGDVKDLAVVLCVENYAMNLHMGAYDIGELGGTVRGAVHAWHKKHKIPTFACAVSPSTLKLFATGKGTADKKAMIAAACKNSGVKISDDNESDAFHLADFAAHCSAAVFGGVGPEHPRIGEFLVNHGLDKWRFV